MRCFAFCPKEAISFKNYRSARYRAVEVDEFLKEGFLVQKYK
jgi:hypothetical protein